MFLKRAIIVAFEQVRHTYDIVNKKGDVTATVVFGEVSVVPYSNPNPFLVLRPCRWRPPYEIW